MQAISILNWHDQQEAWIDKYIVPGTRSGDIELVTDEIGPEIYVFPLFTTAFCQELIELVEARNEWTTSRHQYYPTTDVLLYKLGLEPMYHEVLTRFAHPLARKLWRLEGKAWQDMIEESFIARYRHEEQSSLSIHQDFADYTFTVGLNSDFEGGGTWFARQKVLGNPRNGHCLLFPSITHPHGGRPTTAGKRYICVSFCRRRKLYYPDSPVPKSSAEVAESQSPNTQNTQTSTV